MEYLRKHKLALIILAAALALILLSSFCASMIQSDAFRVKVTDLEDEEFKGTATNRFGVEAQVSGKVASGILFVPKDASENHQLPAVVLTHGYLNDRELQLQNAIELARRGFVVLTIDRGGHGNNELAADKSALTNTDGMYEAVKYLAMQDYVDKTRIGISGHSMGGFTTAMTLMSDMAAGYISAGLMQGWSSFMGAAPGVSVGMLKAQDDEFFFTGTFPDGTPSICREYLHSVDAAKFVGYPLPEDPEELKNITIDIKNGGIYVGGAVAEINGGEAADDAFRVIYESNEIHPLNHFSIQSAASVTNFFYTAFGTPNGHKYIAEGKETWWLKELFSTLGLVGFFGMLLPLVDLLLTLPFFQSLRKKELAEGEIGTMLPELKGVRKHISYWLAGVLTTLFSGFSIQWVYSGSGWMHDAVKMFFSQNKYFPQDTTGTVATWAIVCGLFALFVTGMIWLVNHIINLVQNKKAGEGAVCLDEHPMQPAIIAGGFGSVVKSILLGLLTVGIMFTVVFINWAIWKVDFRIWTLDVQPFEVAVMLPAMMRYAVAFFIFYFINSILNQNYKVKNLPEWATIAINCAFNVCGIVLVMLIQYGTFRTTGVLWQPDMNLGYIVLFPIVPILVIATIFSRRLYERTGNAWLGGIINALLFTIITVANTAASYTFAGFFA